MTHAESVPPFFQPYNPDLVPAMVPTSAHPEQAQLTGLHVAYLRDVAADVNTALRHIETVAHALSPDIDEAALLCEQLDFPQASTGRHMDGRGRATWRYATPIETQDDMWIGSQPQLQTKVVAFSKEELSPQSDAIEALKMLANKQAYDDFFESSQRHLAMISEHPVVLGQHGEPVPGGFSYDAPSTTRGLREQFARNMLKDTGILHTTVTLAVPFNHHSDQQLAIADFATPLRPDAKGELTDDQVSVRRRILYSLISQGAPLATMW